MFVLSYEESFAALKYSSPVLPSKDYFNKTHQYYLSRVLGLWDREMYIANVIVSLQRGITG